MQTEVRATSATDAKWLLQAIHGFHSVASGPTEVHSRYALEEVITPQSAEQQRIANLKAAKSRASKALDSERAKQKRDKAMSTLRSLTQPKPR
jgi:hypothetical protein